MNKKAIFFRTGYLLSALSAAWLFGGCGEPVKPPIVPEVSSVFMESSQGEFEEEWKETAPSDVPEESEDSFSVETSPEELSMAEEGKRGDYLVVIDAGHQKKGNSEKEPIGPGATEEKAKVASGTQGCSTKIPEYELTLAVSKEVEQILLDRGYQVKMVRDTNDVDISNAERAQLANEAGADVFVRIHANGAADSTVNGAETLCQTAQNPYNAVFYEDSRRLSEAVLEGLVEATGCKKRFVNETDTMSGINWCQVPVTIVEVGFMSNPEEDERMATEEYRGKIAEGIANGIDAYFGL